MRALHGFAIAALAAAWPASPIRPAAQGPATLTGLVYDSTGFGALGGVKVSLSGGGTSTFTDSTGHYRLRGLGLGQAQVRFEHPRLNLMLGEVVADVELKSDSTEFNLLVGSRMASHGTMCGTDSVRGAPAAGFFGTVWLGGSDTILTGAEVAATWADVGNNQRRGVVARADQFGSYRLCGIPAGVKALVAARGAGRESEAQELVLEPGEMATWDLVVGAPTTAAERTTVIGQVTNQQNGEPVVGAEVVLLQSGKKAITDEGGNFTLTGAEVGNLVSMVRRIGFRPLYRDIVTIEGQTVKLLYALEPSVARLPTVTVNAPAEADATLKAFEARRGRGLGTFFGPEELRRAENRTLTTVVRAASGLKIIKEPGGGGNIAVSNRRVQNVTTTDRNATGLGRGTGGLATIPLGQAMGFCPYAIVLDGHVIYSSDSGGMPGNSSAPGGGLNRGTTTPPDLNSIVAVASLKAVEVYSGPGETPGEYSHLGAQCGVILLWTK